MRPIARRPPSPSRRQRGAALLTAMIIVTLVATLASAMVWQQWRAVQVEAAERGRAQAAWILTGATDFAKLIIFENRGATTALTDPWATPLAEARISSFLAVDKSNADDGPEAFLSGNIEDAQSRYNLANLVVSGKVDPNGVAILQKLCQAVGLQASIAQTIANGMAQASTSTDASAPLMPASISQLTWFGIDQASIDALSPYVVIIPPQPGSTGSLSMVTTLVNVNTAPAEVLAAVVPGLSSAAHLVQVRQSKPFASVSDFLTQAGIGSGLSATALASLQAQLDIHSNYFLVHGRLRLADHVLLDNSLLYRSGAAQPSVLARERVASVE